VLNEVEYIDEYGVLVRDPERKKPLGKKTRHG